MPKARSPKPRTRYSIGEWYGVDFASLRTEERYQRAKDEVEVDGLTGKSCPFRTIGPCNKKGGVCTIRQYSQLAAEPVVAKGPLITTCPQRFGEAGTIFRWVGETILDAPDAIVLGEVGFLDRFRPDQPPADDEQDTRDFIGRIDNVLVHPTRKPLDWCALELQAVYFSGKSMRTEFKALAESVFPALAFPAAHRRPDWRSSGPKRLLPQLQTKVPTIRTWGKKMAVVIDEAFFASLVGLERERHLSNAEIAWFVVGYDQDPNGWKLRPRQAVFTKLDASVKSLTGGVPLSKPAFENQLRKKIAARHPEHPLSQPHSES